MPMNYKLDTNAIINSLRDAFLVPRDYDAIIARLTKTLNRLPKGRLQITHTHNGVFFYLEGRYLRKSSDLIYSLARRRYCETLLQVIRLCARHQAGTSSNSPFLTGWARAFEKLERLIRDFSKGNLKLERILLTPQQYTWYYGRYHKKMFPQDPAASVLLIPQGDPVRSKSEQRIGIELHNYAVPCHYEEQLLINVQSLVQSLKAELKQQDQLPRDLYSYQGYSCIWNVPRELSWMNAPGSIWRSYDDRTGCLTLYPDYTIMLADGRLLYWEHEGMLHQFFYRTNALERVEIMQQSGRIPKTCIIETNEQQANDLDVLREIIRNRILPYLWF
ncbi:MAG: hypothetical protein IJ109_07630 [Firmicutes bacterium]|nr:hypothetical protein [Bacillota bacterium]